MALNPSELLQIGLAEDQVKRYVNLKYKTELEADKNTIYCPRQWCQGAARSKKHKKPSGLEFAQASEGESDDDGEEMTVEGDAARDADNANHNENNGGNNNNTAQRKKKATESKKFNPADLLAVCEDCGFAFCSRCSQSWHGEFYRCSAKRNKEELSAEEQASLEYLKLHTSPCPTCDAPAQKTHGCNHMICGRCDTHFCYLCSSWLDPVNPYKHYNQPPTSMYGGSTCYMRLWELQEGDGNDVGQGYDGGRELAVIADALDGVREVEIEENLLRNLNHDVDGDVDGEGDEGREPRRRAPAHPRLERRGQVAIAREAPLVLRLMEDPAPNQAVAAPPPVPPPPNQQHHPAGREENRPRRGGGRGAPARGRGGRGGAGRPTGAGAVDRGDQPRRRNPQAANGQRDAPRGGALVAGGAPRQRQGNENENGVELDAAQEAWVRNFVQMALMDVEDQIVGDSDSDDNENWLIQ
jgi:E3 ubiquitin-protein ligase RNF14